MTKTALKNNENQRPPPNAMTNIILISAGENQRADKLSVERRVNIDKALYFGRNSNFEFCAIPIVIIIG